jgi:hypothetical protein
MGWSRGNHRRGARADNRQAVARDGSRQVRTVFKNEEVAHAWAQRSQSAGRSHNGNFHFLGDVLYSYETPIAAFHAAPDGRTWALISSRNFSPQTSQHQGDARSALGAPYRYNREAIDADTRAKFDALGIAGVFYTSHVQPGSWPFMSREGSGIDAAEMHRLNVEARLANARSVLDHASRETLGRDGSDVQRDTDALRSALADHAAAVEYADAFSRRGYPAVWPAKDRRATRAEFERRGAAVADRFARLRAERNSPAYLKAQERKAAKKAEAERLTRESITAAVDIELAAQGWPDWIGRTYAGLGADGTTQYRHLEGEELDAARASWRESIIAERTRRALKDERRRERERKEREERDEIRAAWIAREPWRGEMIRLQDDERTDADGSAFFRLDGEALESSQGVRVPLANAVRVFQFARLCKERGEGWRANGRSLRVGTYTIDRVDADGSFIAGCHKVTWPQIEAAARLAGVLDVEAADTTDHREHA